MQDDHYCVIFGWMTNDLELAGNELLIYSSIYGFSQDGQSCFKGSRKWLAETFNISLPTVDKALKSLIEKGLIEKTEHEINGVKFYDYKTLQGVKKLYTPRKETLQGGCKETLHHNTNIQNIDNNTRRDITSISSKKSNGLDDVLLSVALIRDTPDLLQAFRDFIDMRNKIKKPLTVRALQLSVNEAYKLAGGDTGKMRAIVEQSVQRSWQGIFPLKDDQIIQPVSTQQKNSKSSFWDAMLQEAENNAETDTNQGIETIGGFIPEQI